MTDFKACKIAPFLPPCCIVTPDITHYVMLINANDLDRCPSAFSHQKKTALTQPCLKLSPKAIRDVPRETATTLSTTPWYSIFECYDLEPYLRLFELQTAV
jgi:hypothetical protein